MWMKKKRKKKVQTTNFPNWMVQAKIAKNRGAKQIHTAVAAVQWVGR
jgi:hypothetical protein